MPCKNYMFCKKGWVWSFDRSMAGVRPALDRRFGAGTAACIEQEARQAYEELIPRIPFIGASNPMLAFLLPTTRSIALYHALQQHNLAIEEAGPLIVAMGVKELERIPMAARRFIRYAWFAPWFKARLRKRAMVSQRRRYPGNYVFSYVVGDGQAFDYGVDYFECAGYKLLKAENVFELAPYICSVDQAASELLGWGLGRTMTLAEGFPKCDFRFKQGGPTHVRLPQAPYRDVS